MVSSPQLYHSPSAIRGGGSSIVMNPDGSATVTLVASKTIAIGTGDFYDYATTDNLTRYIDVRSGTVASPTTTLGPLIHLSKVENYTVAQLTAITGGNAGSTQLIAPLVVSNKNTSDSEVQVGAGFFHALTVSTSDRTGGKNPDAVAVFAQAWVTAGIGTASGVYAEGRRDINTAQIHAVEARVVEESGSAAAYTGSTFTGTVGVWVTVSGDANAAAGIQLGSADGVRKFTTGIGVAGDAVTTTFLYDTSSAATSIRIGGTHATAAMIVDDGSGPVLIGSATQMYTGAGGSLLEVTDATSHDPLVVFGSTTNNIPYSVYWRNGQGIAMIAVSGGNDQFMTGSVTGDMVIRNTSAGKAVLIGGTTRVIEITQDNLLGLFAVAPVAQQAGIADADGTLADITTKFNTWLAAAEAYGLLAVA